MQLPEKLKPRNERGETGCPDVAGAYLVEAGPQVGLPPVCHLLAEISSGDVSVRV